MNSLAGRRCAPDIQGMQEGRRGSAAAKDERETVMEEMRGRRSHTEVYLHCIWATRRRAPFVVPALERRIHRCIQSQARGLGCTVLALNGMTDHIHLLVRVPPTLATAPMIQQVKGASSYFTNKVCALTEALYWQEGYSAFSVSRSHLARVVAYIKAQKQRHADGDLWEEWEWCSEEDEEMGRREQDE